MNLARILWHRLDVRGHESAQIERIAGGWRLFGVAIYSVLFASISDPCRLEYSIECDERWITRRCAVRGWLGLRDVSVSLERDARGAWLRDGVEVPEVAGCVDVDLAFSPVTNTIPIRRLALDVGGSASVRAAWLRVDPMSLEPLEQRYTRIAPNQYLYESDGGAFRRTISVDPNGLVLEYPRAWVAETRVVDPRDT